MRFLAHGAFAGNIFRFQVHFLAEWDNQRTTVRCKDRLKPEFRMDEMLPQILGIGWHVRKRLKWEEFDDKDICRFVRIVGVSPDEMIQLSSTPCRINLVLGQQ